MKRSQKSSQGSAWLSYQLYILLSSLGNIVRTPLPSLMMVGVIGIALALPTGLYLLLENVQYISRDWGGAAQISLFLRHDLGENEIEDLADRLYQHPDISNVRLITPADALKEYQTFSGDALQTLSENPLPTVLVIQPASSDNAINQILLEKLQELAEVEVAQFDMLWAKRLFAMLEIVQRGTLILAILLSLAVLLIVGNTIRLAVQSRRKEIEINKLVGATDAFIRQPFLYTGFWYGLLGGTIAWLLITISLWSLQGPVKKLTALYYSKFELITLGMLPSATLLLVGILLGLIGAWISVNRHLRDIQPS
ncbi:permease-like cell division protein FtsX [Candidatus Halobeggiatoa sp. HSG11]|nr:permease-like cell division protein FtsX [Candidatus Halobeggiatoa sp. HSG11]